MLQRNADTAAAQIAIALKARRLVYLSGVPGLLKDPEDPATCCSSLAVHQVEPLKEEKVIAKGMLPKVNSVVDALNAGVNRVHFIDEDSLTAFCSKFLPTKESVRRSYTIDWP